MKLKIRAEELMIGGLLGGGVGLAVTAPLVLLAGPLPGFTPSAMAGEPMWAAALHAAMLGAAVACAAAGAWIAARQESEQHVRGARFYQDLAEATAVLQGLEDARMSPAQRAGQVQGLALAGLRLSRKREVAHQLFIGLPEAGKTTVIRSDIDQAIERRDRVLLHDPKSDFVRTHFDPAHAVILGPWDARSAIWDAASDIDSPALADEFAASVCGVADSGQNRYFHSGAATLLGGLIKSYMRGGAAWTWHQIARDLGSDPIALVQRAALGDPLVRQAMPSVFAPRKPGQPPALGQGERSILSTLANSSRILMQLGAVDAARPDAPRFSLRRWMLGTAHSEIRLVILNSNAMYATAQETLWGAMLSGVSATISAQMPEKSADDDGALWLIADEAPQLGPAGLERLLVIQEVGRSRGVRVIIAAQEESQFAARCGMEKAAPMLSMQGLKIYGRCSDATADAIARRVGNREIQRLENTASGGAVQGKTSRHDSVPVLVPSDITGLRLTDDGPELLVQIGDVIGRVVQPFGPKPIEREPQLIECPAWRAARLPDPPAPQPQPTPPQATPPPTDGGGRAPQEQEPAFDLDRDIESPFGDAPTPAPGADTPAQDADDATDWTKE